MYEMCFGIAGMTHFIAMSKGYREPDIYDSLYMPAIMLMQVAAYSTFIDLP